MNRHIATCLAATAVLSTGVDVATAYADETERVQKSIVVLQELTGAEDADIPQYILDRAEAIVVIPSFKKAGFIIGAEHGKGILSVRDRATRSWSPPAFVKMTGGNFGAQIGVESVELVFVVVERSGIDALLSNKFTFGGELSVAAGPVGRTARAGTDVRLEAKILAYSRSKGLFAGAALNGTTLHTDDDGNRKFYGRPLGTRDIVTGKQLKPSEIPAVAKQWQNTLGRVAGRSS